MGYSVTINPLIRASRAAKAHVPRFSRTPENAYRRSRLKVRGLRFYNPDTTKWLSRDPIEENGGLNLYAFCGNEPVGGWDALGLQGCNPERKKKCGCCCCVRELNGNASPKNWSDYHIGHILTISISIEYVKRTDSEEFADCGLQWWEWTKEKGNKNKWPKQWKQLYGKVSSGTFDEWDTREKKCGENESVKLEDEPDISSRGAAENELWIGVKITSGEGCEKVCGDNDMVKRWRGYQRLSLPKIYPEDQKFDINLSDFPNPIPGSPSGF